MHIPTSYIRSVGSTIAYLACGVVAAVVIAYGFAIQNVNDSRWRHFDENQTSELWSLFKLAKWGKPDAGGEFLLPGMRVEYVGGNISADLSGKSVYSNYRPDIIRRYSIGFPFEAITGIYVGDPFVPVYTEHLIENPIYYNRNNKKNAQYLPVGIIFTGLLCNSILYAVILRLIMMARRAWMISNRRKRGLCLACKYPIKETRSMQCPECGKILNE